MHLVKTSCIWRNMGYKEWKVKGCNLYIIIFDIFNKSKQEQKYIYHITFVLSIVDFDARASD